MNAGDEMRLRFPAPPLPASGWQRDFVLIGDGWEKDGDYNTDYSSTVLPLPSTPVAPIGRHRHRSSSKTTRCIERIRETGTRITRDT